MAENFFLDNDDLRGQFKRVVAEPSAYEDVLTAIGEFAAREIAPKAAEVDAWGCRLENGETVVAPALQRHLDQMRELGFYNLFYPKAYGGEDFPMTIAAMVFEILSRACPSTMIQFAYRAAAGRVLAAHGTEEQKKLWLPKMAAGEASCAVALTEPDAGSDLRQLKTSAVRDGNRWRLRGQKIFITNGGADVCYVLARTDPNAKGFDGMSMFLVPARLDGKRNFTVVREEVKLALRGSPTNQLAFDDSVGDLMSAEGKGLDVMFSFVNEGRVAVGIQSLGVAESAYRRAKKFADWRVSMGRPIAKHELIAERLMRMDAEIRGIRAFIYAAAALQEREPGSRLLRRWTPLIKLYAPERCLAIAREAVMIHGGYGVMAEYDVERHYRDAAVFPLYEGTTQMQALMFLKDSLKSVQVAPVKTVFELMGAKFGEWVAGSDLEAAVEHARAAELSIRLRLARRVGAERAAEQMPDDPTGLGVYSSVRRHAERLAGVAARSEILRALAAQDPKLAGVYAQITATEIDSLERETRGGDAILREWMKGP